MSSITRTAGKSSGNIKKVSYYFETYMPSFRDLHTFYLKPLGLNIITYGLDNIIQVALFGWESVNMVMLIFKHDAHIVR